MTFFSEIIKKSDASSVNFIQQMEYRYPEHIYGYDIEHMEQLYDKIYLANCHWNKTIIEIETLLQPQDQTFRPRRRSDNYSDLVNKPEVAYSSTSKQNSTNGSSTSSQYSPHVYYTHTHSIWEEIAHGLHKASITILGILVVEVSSLYSIKYKRSDVQIVVIVFKFNNIGSQSVIRPFYKEHTRIIIWNFPTTCSNTSKSFYNVIGTNE